MVELVRYQRSMAWSVAACRLARWVFEEYRISVTKQILSRERYGYRKLSARPRHHAQDEAAPPLAALAEVAQCQAAAAAIIGELRVSLVRGAREGRFLPASSIRSTFNVHFIENLCRNSRTIFTFLNRPQLLSSLLQALQSKDIPDTERSRFSPMAPKS